MNANNYLNKKYQTIQRKNFLKLVAIQMIVPYILLVLNIKNLATSLIIFAILISNLITLHIYELSFNKTNVRFQKFWTLFF